jgi:transcriptional regulator with XRE-family HTH domain
MPSQTSTAEAVRGAREAYGLSQRKLATRLGWHQPRLSRREMGEVAFRYDELREIADILGFDTVDALLTTPTIAPPAPQQATPGDGGGPLSSSDAA